MDKTKGTSGQRGKAISISFESLNDNEKQVLSCLKAAGQKLKINQIVELSGWDKPCKAKGSSMVRNAMRRLVKGGFVLHGSHIGDGTYAAADSLVVAAPRNPQPISKEIVEGMQEDNSIAERIKRTDCSLYNACLDQAISGKWPGFACTSCNAYSETDSFQKELDHLGLACIGKAVEMIERYGKIHRVRGVKPGAEAKRTRRDSSEDTVSLGEALASAD